MWRVRRFQGSSRKFLGTDGRGDVQYPRFTSADLKRDFRGTWGRIDRPVGTYSPLVRLPPGTWTSVVSHRVWSPSSGGGEEETGPGTVPHTTGTHDYLHSPVVQRQDPSSGPRRTSWVCPGTDLWEVPTTSNVKVLEGVYGHCSDE